MAMTGPLLDAEHAPCALAALSEDGHVLEVNGRLCEMLGQTRAALFGKHVDLLFRPASRLLFHTHVLPLLELHGQVNEVDLPLLRTDGTQVDTLLSATRQVEDGRAVVRCAFLMLRERRRVEEELLNAKRAAEQVPGLLFQLRRHADGQLQFVYCTDSILDLYGVSPQQARQSAAAVWSRLHPQDGPRVQAEIELSAQSLHTWRSEFRICFDKSTAEPTAATASDEQWRELHAAPQRERDGTVLWNGYSCDITERKKLETLTRNKEAAERATQAKSAFLARMSHELRTPLNGILGFVQILQMQASQRLNEKDRSHLGHIEAAGRHLLELINEVLDISSIEAGHMQVQLVALPVVESVQDVLRLLSPLAHERQIAMSLVQAEDCVARADPQRLRQCLTNLVSNAIKYNRPQGRISVAISRLHQQVQIDIEDEGTGLSEAQQTQLFQPFNRLGAESTHTEGTGLGLVITRNLIDLMGGQLLLRSQPGKGCCFSIVLPAVQPAGTATAPELVAEDPGTGRAGSDAPDDTGQYSFQSADRS